MTHKQTFDLKMADSHHETIGTLPIRIDATDFTISLYPQGYGDCGSAEGHGCPVSLELYQGRLRLIVFPDINTEEPTIIDLNGAREDRRKITSDQEETPA